MAAIVSAVGMRIAGFAALVAVCNYIFCNALTKPVIEYEIFTDEFTLQPFFFDLLSVIDNAAF